jgi:uncharacterized protein (TIGR02453 family)
MKARKSQPTLVPFTGFGPRALDFFRALAFHQSKQWFEENRAIYDEEVRAPLEALLAQLSAELEDAGLPIRGGRASIFRLHRDTRFGKDKRPYKTNSGAVLSRDGTKRSQGFVYLHLDPEGCFAAAGFWQPEPAQLLAIRRAIADRPDKFRDVVAKLAQAGLAFGDGDPLSRLPKGFEDVAEADLAAAVKMRNVIVRRPIEADSIRSPAFVQDLVRFSLDAEPLLRFGWTALDTPEPA